MVDSKQLAAAEAFVARGAWVGHLVLAEATWVLTSVYDRREETATAVEMLLKHQHRYVRILHRMDLTVRSCGSQKLSPEESRAI